MSVELSQLRWAIVVAQHRSLRQAAEVLNVRQSTLSRRLRALEHQLGSALFKRTNGGTKPTIEGQEFLEAARRIVEASEVMTARFKTRSRGETGRLAIGVQASLSAGNLRATLAEYHERFPEVELRLVDGSSDDLHSDLANSSIDVAFVIENIQGPGERSLSVWSERVVIALPGHHHLSTSESVRWSDLVCESMLVPQRGPGPEFLKLVMSKTGYPDDGRIHRHDVSLDRLLTLVGSGCGVLLALEGATGAIYPGVTYREVHDRDGPTRLGFRVVWKGENCNPSLSRFLEMIRERYPDLSIDPDAE